MKIQHFILGSFLISFGILIFGEAGVLSAYRTSQAKAKLEARIHRLEDENAGLEKQIQALNNPHFLEFTIRKSLSLVESDEILYDFQ